MSNLPIKRDEIHPVNPYRPPSAPTAFKLIKWKPIYDMIVAGHIIGKSNKELAETYDYTTVSIVNILRSDRAQQMIAEAHKNIRENIQQTVTDQMDLNERIRQKALERVEDFLDNDELATNSPFAYMNTISKYTGISAQNVPTVNVQTNIQNNQTNISESSLNRLTKALEISEGMILGPLDE
jgi:hypothetical protein